MQAVSNSNSFDTRVFERGTYVLELETRYSLFSQPGKLRTIAWLNSAFSAATARRWTIRPLSLISRKRAGAALNRYVINLEQA